jgi:hypothetical protein
MASTMRKMGLGLQNGKRIHADFVKLPRWVTGMGARQAIALYATTGHTSPTCKCHKRRTHTLTHTKHKIRCSAKFGPMQAHMLITTAPHGICWGPRGSTRLSARAISEEKPNLHNYLGGNTVDCIRKMASVSRITAILNSQIPTKKSQFGRECLADKPSKNSSIKIIIIVGAGGLAKRRSIRPRDGRCCRRMHSCKNVGRLRQDPAKMRLSHGATLKSDGRLRQDPAIEA